MNENKKPKIIIVRVYGLIVNNDQQILLSDEFFKDTYITKFPGGGLESGEGTIDCLKREALEELGQEIEVLDHFYTTDFYQQGYFNPDSQIISIYYTARLIGKPIFRISHKKFDFETEIDGNQSFRFIPVKALEKEMLTLPIDRLVAEKFRNQY